MHEKRFQDSPPDSTMRRLWDEKVADQVSSASEGLNVLKNMQKRHENAALYSEILHTRAVMAREDECGVATLWTSSIRSPLAMAVVKDAPYAKVLDRMMLQARIDLLEQIV